jgi:UrcA family protein
MTMLRLSNTALFTSVACAFGLLSAGAPAHAQDAHNDFTIIVQGDTPHPDTLSARVPYGDLDLTTWSGQKVLMHRVREAAHAMCRQLDDEPGPVELAFQCEDQAVQKAAADESAVIARAKTQTYATIASAASAPGR